ncbi:hypothetical protein KGP36_02500 [Patescibacteria group bacterium]|nr:hypothetical protein [Patescibacteria group bacterium]
MSRRFTLEAWAMGVANVTARRSTCLRRAVGCVLLNERGHVLATGYNGVPAGMEHCNEEFLRPFNPKEDAGDVTKAFRPLPDKSGLGTITFPHACPGADAPSGTALDACHAVHAEQNALLQCRDPWSIATCVVTASPCVTCTKLLLNTSCKRILFGEDYPQPEAKALWIQTGRLWEQLLV